jgi:murein DD-endopeptidase MepM/ murein hydrolase activator NlpD
MKRICFIFIAAFAIACKNRNSAETTNTETAPVPVIEFGFDLNNYIVKRDTVRNGDSFGQILLRNNIAHGKIFEIVEKTKDSFNTKKLRAGKPYTLLCTKDSLQQPQCFIYQPNAIDYVVINFTDSIHAYSEQKPVKLVEKMASATITSSLSKAIAGQGLPYQVANDLSTIYAWTVDFFKLQKGDLFTVIYDEKYINDSLYAGIDNIKAAYFQHKGKVFYAFRFTTDSINQLHDYYDEKANSLRRAFLKAPLQYSRISSRYSPRRFHPVQKIWKPHFGTDYAAPYGTPIMATANGTVVKAGYTAGNGKFVKIRHNSTYETQYLHMSERAVKEGQYVQQGEVIGYVGSSGLATGPHVCYRFWKNGVQIDPFQENLPSSQPIEDSLKIRYLEYIKPFKKQLDNITKNAGEEQLAANSLNPEKP